MLLQPLRMIFNKKKPMPIPPSNLPIKPFLSCHFHWSTACCFRKVCSGFVVESSPAIMYVHRQEKKKANPNQPLKQLISFKYLL